RGNLKQGRIERLPRKFYNFFSRGEGHSAIRTVGGRCFLERIAGSRRTLPVKANGIVAAASRRGHTHNRSAPQIAVKTKRKIYVPTIRFHPLLELTTGIWRRLNAHACLNVPSLKPKHLFTLAGIGRVGRIGNDAAISRRFDHRTADRSRTWLSVRSLHRRDDILFRTVADLNSSLQVTLGNVDYVS